MHLSAKSRLEPTIHKNNAKVGIDHHQMSAPTVRLVKCAAEVFKHMTPSSSKRNYRKRRSRTMHKSMEPFDVARHTCPCPPEEGYSLCVLPDAPRGVDPVYLMYTILGNGLTHQILFLDAKQRDVWASSALTETISQSFPLTDHDTVVGAGIVGSNTST
jgi:hypothetical protein